MHDIQDVHVFICSLIVMTFVLFLLQVTLGGPGQRAGLRVGDVVLEVNRQNVADQYLEDVIVLMKWGGNILSLIVTEQTGHDQGRKTHVPHIR